MRRKSELKKATLFLVLIVVLIQGCVVLSFYPLYENEDLFPNNLLEGKWLDGDTTLWVFEHPSQKKDGVVEISDSAGYKLKLYPVNKHDEESELQVNIVKLGETYYLDFYVTEYGPKNDDMRESYFLVDLHMLPVHTFAKLTNWNDSALIQWLSPSWLQHKIDEDSVSIRHERDNDLILLTAQPKEIQRFIQEYVNDDKAFELDVTIYRQKNN